MDEFQTQTQYEYYRGDNKPNKKMKQCKYCNNMIDKKAKVCPYCQNQRRNTMFGFDNKVGSGEQDV